MKVTTSPRFTLTSALSYIQPQTDNFELILLQGVNARIVTGTVRDGYTQFMPLLGDMVSQIAETTQARVSVNGIPSECSGTCSYQWATDKTASLSSVTPMSGE